MIISESQHVVASFHKHFQLGEAASQLTYEPCENNLMSTLTSETKNMALPKCLTTEPKGTCCKVKETISQTQDTINIFLSYTEPDHRFIRAIYSEWQEALQALSMWYLCFLSFKGLTLEFYECWAYIITLTMTPSWGLYNVIIISAVWLHTFFQ